MRCLFEIFGVFKNTSALVSQTRRMLRCHSRRPAAPRLPPLPRPIARRLNRGDVQKQNIRGSFRKFSPATERDENAVSNRQRQFRPANFVALSAANNDPKSLERSVAQQLADRVHGHSGIVAALAALAKGEKFRRGKRPHPGPPGVSGKGKDDGFTLSRAGIGPQRSYQRLQIRRGAHTGEFCRGVDAARG